jgi:hypothetical protein
MKHRYQALAFGLAAALACAPAFAQYSTSAISRVNGNVSITGTTLDDNTLAAPTDPLTPEARNDQALLSGVVNALATDPRMQGARVDVQVGDGRVTLGGIVRDMAQSDAARSITDSVAGSANVVNRLTTGG